MKWPWRGRSHVPPNEHREPPQPLPHPPPRPIMETYWLCPLCGQPGTAYEAVAIMENRMHDPQPLWPGGPVYDASPLAPRQVPVAYNYTFQPCGCTSLDPPPIVAVEVPLGTPRARAMKLLYEAVANA